VEKKRIDPRTGKSVAGGWGIGSDPANQHKGGFGPIRPETISRTLGWRPGCDCNVAYPDTHLAPDDAAFVPHEPVPCIVLDPFSGAGTTVMVALRLGRRAIGIELSEDYVAMSEKRIRADVRAMSRRMEL